MAITLVNSVVSWFLKKRIHQIEFFLKYPIEVQEELLFGLLDRAKSTEIGKKYEFSSIQTYREFSNRIPIVTYEDLEGLIEKNRLGQQYVFWDSPIKWFAKSSGTTSAKSKFI